MKLGEDVSFYHLRFPWHLKDQTISLWVRCDAVPKHLFSGCVWSAKLRRPRWRKVCDMKCIVFAYFSLTFCQILLDNPPHDLGWAYSCIKPESGFAPLPTKSHPYSSYIDNVPYGDFMTFTDPSSVGNCFAPHNSLRRSKLSNKIWEPRARRSVHTSRLQIEGSESLSKLTNLGGVQVLTWW